MRNLVFTLAAFAVLFSACSKDEDDSTSGTLNGGNNNTEAKKGCTDPIAINYDSAATQDDGSCNYITDTIPTDRTAILEEFTGVRCPFCPDGKRRAQNIKDDYPESFFMIAIHGGYLSDPYSGDPDLVIDQGSTVLQYCGAGDAGYPSGAINRHDFGGSQLAMGRGQWSSNVETILNQSSPVNVGIQTELDKDTRELTVKAEVYYTEDIEGANKLTVVILEDGINATQDTQSGKDNEFIHDDVLRDFLSQTWGDEISNTQKGERTQKQYTYQIPSNISIENAEIAAFVAKDKEEIYTGHKQEVKTE